MIQESVPLSSMTHQGHPVDKNTKSTNAKKKCRKIWNDRAMTTLSSQYCATGQKQYLFHNKNQIRTNTDKNHMNININTKCRKCRNVKNEDIFADNTVHPIKRLPIYQSSICECFHE